MTEQLLSGGLIEGWDNMEPECERLMSGVGGGQDIAIFDFGQIVIDDFMTWVYFRCVVIQIL